jgi:hypothetical protein
VTANTACDGGACDYGRDPSRAAATEAPRLVPLVGGVGALAGEVAELTTVVAPTAATTTSAITAATIPAATLVTVPGHVPFLATLVAVTAAATAAVATSSTVPAAAPTSAVPAAAVPASVVTSASVTSASVAAAAVTVAATAVTVPAATTRTGTGGERATAGRGDVDGLGAAIVAGSDDELDGVALVEAAEAVGLDGGLVHEEVLAAAFGGDEAEPLGAVEPLDGASHPLRRHLGRRSKENPRLERRAVGSAVDLRMARTVKEGRLFVKGSAWAPRRRCVEKPRVSAVQTRPLTGKWGQKNIGPI